MALTQWTQNPANQPGTSTVPADRSTEFVPDSGGGDTTSASLMLVCAYVAMWALLIGFIGLGWRRQQKLFARIEQLERAVERVDGSAAR